MVALSLTSTGNVYGNEWEFNVHMAICDGGQADRNFILTYFDSKEDAIEKKFPIFSEITGSMHVFIVDSSVSFISDSSYSVGTIYSASINLYTALRCM